MFSGVPSRSGAKGGVLVAGWMVRRPPLGFAARVSIVSCLVSLDVKFGPHSLSPGPTETRISISPLFSSSLISR